MCSPATCPTCKKATYSGCGNHVEAVLGHVPADQRCACPPRPRGGWFRFDRSSASVLAKLLSAIAVYATGGLKALEIRGTREDRLLLAQMKGGGS